eukprot:gene9769-9926_t
MAWDAAVNSGQPPNIWSTWSVWKRGLAPAITGRLAAAKVTLFPAAKKSLLVFSFDHAICDYPTAYNFMYLWFEEAAAAAAAACLAAGSAVNTDGLKMLPVDALWDPLNPADACRQAWRVVVDGMTYRFSVWRIPRSLIEEWKVAAAAACPLPEGNWYSSNNAATAMLAATLYKASPAKARAQGGLHVAAVVDLRGNRCGLTIPRDSATNPSVWGIRTWVPDSVLAAADGRPTPELMHHLREGLNKQLKEPRGSINKMGQVWQRPQCAGFPAASSEW